MDLRQHLQDLSGSPVAPTEAQVAADLTRGRHALRRRRTAQTLAGSAFGVAALVAGFAVASTGPGAGAPDQPSDSRPAVVTVAKLVAYRGTQPKGFTIDKVPAGWFIQADEVYSLTLAPIRVRDPGPDVDPSKDPIYDRQTYVGKIGIMLEDRSQNGPGRPGIAVTVGGRKGTLVKSLPGMTPDGPLPTPANGDTGWQLWVERPTGAHLVVQFWEGLGMSRDQMIELAAGVHVEKAAERTG